MEKITIAYQGKPGAYSQKAIKKFTQKYNIKAESKSTENFNELFENIENITKIGIVPIENSNAGSVVDNYDLFQTYEVEIIAEINLEINHALLANKNTKFENITHIYSHPQALAQCSNFIQKNNLKSTPVLDTAGASEEIAKNKSTNIASISSNLAAKIYDLQILKKKIQNADDNTTRFFIVKNKNFKFEFEKQVKEKQNKATLSFKTKDIAGSLYKCIGAFATNNINLTKIESRPDKEKKFYYTFFIDVEDNLKSKQSKQALDELKYFSKEYKILGTYQKDS